MKLLVRNTPDGLIPLYDADYDNRKRLKLGVTYSAEFKEERNYEFHKKFFSLLECVWQLLNEIQQEFFHNSKECFRQTLIVSAGFCDRVFSFTKGEWQDVPKSISFSKMDEIEFQELYERVKDVLFISILKNITEEEFLTILSQF